MRAALGLTVACAAHFLIGADGLAVAIALPHVQETFGVPAIDAQWMLTAYAVFFSSFLLLGGRLGDLYGRRLMLTAGMLAFAGGSLLAGVAPGLLWLVVGRVLQGLGAAAAVPAALALIGSIYPPGPARTRALSAMGAMAAVGVMSGLVVAGVVVDQLGWRWVFLLMAAPSVVAAVAAPFVLPEARIRESTRIDVGGAVLACAGLMALLFGLTRIEHDGLVAVTPLVSLAVGALLLAAFAVWERRVFAPLMRFGILRVRSLRAASLGIGANAVAFTALVYVGTLYLQNGLGYSASEAAFAILPIDATGLAIAAFARRFVRGAPAVPLAVCVALLVASMVWLARAPVPANYWVDLLPPLLVLGVALMVIFIITTHQAVADVDADDKGLASGVFETANHLFGGAMGVAVYASVLAVAHSYEAAFLVAGGLVVVFGLGAVSQSIQRRPVT